MIALEEAPSWNEERGWSTVKFTMVLPGASTGSYKCNINVIHVFMIVDCRIILLERIDVNVTCTKCSANLVAHKLARVTCSISDRLGGDVPTDVLNLLIPEQIGQCISTAFKKEQCLSPSKYYW